MEQIEQLFNPDSQRTTYVIRAETVRYFLVGGGCGGKCAVFHRLVFNGMLTTVGWFQRSRHRKTLYSYMQQFAYLCKLVRIKNCTLILQYSRQQGFAPGPTGAPAPSSLPFAPPRKYFCYATVMQTEKCQLFAERKKVVNLRHGEDNVVCLCNMQNDACILIMTLLLHTCSSHKRIT